MTVNPVGWDIGGANLKAARQGDNGWEVRQQPFAIWQKRDDLVDTLREMAAGFGPMPQAAVTITAELSDAFRTKREGITVVLDALEAAWPHTELHIFGVDGRFHPPALARTDPLRVAAANWLATALLVAHQFSDCLLVDIGSTTTDIIPVCGRQVAAQGRNDPQRLVRGELLYTGALRTPVCAIVSRVPLWGQWCPVAAELFATAQDVHLLLGNLTVDQCTSPSADGRPVTPEFAAERLARVVCADIDMLTTLEIKMIARHIAAEQVRQIAGAMAQVLSATAVAGPVVGVGVGAFLAQLAAKQVGQTYLAPDTLLGGNAGQVAPAAAVATLLNATREYPKF